MRSLLLGILAASVSMVAFPASITINCDSFSVQQNGANIVLNCSGVPGQPVTPPANDPGPSVPVIPPAPANGLVCDATNIREAGKRFPIRPGEAKAFSFVASGVGKPSLQYNNVSAVVSISSSPCDFSPPNPSKCMAVSTVSPGVYYSTEPSETRFCQLNQGQTYYMNVRMATRDATGNLIEACLPTSTSDYFPGFPCEFMIF